MQDLDSGEVEVIEVAAPAPPSVGVLVATRYSLISAGTERAMLEFGRQSLLGKARARPDLAGQVIASARAEGVRATYRKAQARLAAPRPLGYSCAGVVLEAAGGTPARPGELVACAGAGYANHAEVVSIPHHLCARVPAGVDPQDAAYTTVAAIALHGVRTGGVELGAAVVVVGLGLVGQLALDLAAAAGARAVGYDPDPTRTAIAQSAGHLATSEERDLAALVGSVSDDRGADVALVAAASRDPAPLLTAVDVVRDRAVVCVIGDVQIAAPRTALYEKELSLVVSRSYGPGRYDHRYEEQAVDYPAAYVRWTEGRNLGEVLRLMGAGRLQPARLTTHVLDVDAAAEAYALLGGGSALGVLLRYPDRADAVTRTVAITAKHSGSSSARRPVQGQGAIRIGVLGAGDFARGVLLPPLARLGQLTVIGAATGGSARATAERFGAPISTTDPARVLEGDDVDAVVIATRHDSHAGYVAQALSAGKHVFVEKPLAIDEEELMSLEEVAEGAPGILMVGFNRRYAPLALALKRALGGRGPLIVTYRINAGALPDSHWLLDPAVGGGRIVGEVCHFVDFAAFLCGAVPTHATAVAMRRESALSSEDVISSIELSDGSAAAITYAAGGDGGMSKERIEVMGGGRAAVLEDFRELHLYTGRRAQVTKQRRDKGHAAEIEAFIEAARTGVQPWPVQDMVAVTRATFDLRDQVGAGPIDA
jgi:predicted dehydrogenase/threonine dehydrogenase-like Zn-dependent dehydrogenase